MATVKKATAVIIIFFIVRTFIACCDCENDFSKTSYSVDGMSIETLDNSGAKAVVSAGPIPKTAFGISVNFSGTEQVEKRTAVASLFTNAQACDCTTGEYIPLDTITSIKIVTHQDFDNEHPTESDVTALFKVKGYDTYYAVNTLFGPAYSGFSVFLLTPPAASGVYNFSVEIKFLDDRTLTATTNEVPLE